MSKQVKRISNTPFDDVFRTLLEKCNKLIIPVINEIFHTDYSLKEEVQVLANEQFFIEEDGSELKNVTDSYLKIRDNIYHLECQSTDDTYMEIRMMEYDFHIAIDNVDLDDDKSYRVRLPQSAVIVLRGKIKFSKFLKVKLEVPRYDSANIRYDTIEYLIPTCNVSHYTIEDICRKNLLFLTPYYIIRFEEMLAQINDDANRLNELKEEYQILYDEIMELAEKEGLARDYLHDIICLTEKIIKHIAKDMENVKREVIQMGGNILKLDREILEENAEKRGEQKGEGKLGSLICNMIQDGYNQDDIIKVSSDEDYREEMYRKYNIKQ